MPAYPASLFLDVPEAAKTTPRPQQNFKSRVSSYPSTTFMTFTDCIHGDHSECVEKREFKVSVPGRLTNVNYECDCDCHYKYTPITDGYKNSKCLQNSHDECSGNFCSCYCHGQKYSLSETYVSQQCVRRDHGKCVSGRFCKCYCHVEGIQNARYSC